MQTTNFQRITDTRKRRIYQALWGNDSFRYFSDKIAPTLWNYKPSLNSYSFFLTGDTERDLWNVFQLEDSQEFSLKFWESCTGTGREYSCINTLHSSALCALLFFYNVTDSNPLSLTVDGHNIRFTRSFFEYQNTVFPGHNPSNIDVTLCGTDESGKSVILFLESKFSEYYLYASGHSAHFSREYLICTDSRPFFQKSMLDRLGFQVSESAEKFCLMSEELAYSNGIKQLIAHYMGIKNLIAGTRNCRGSDFVSEAVAVHDSARVYLGSIVFDRIIGDFPLTQTKTALEAYSDLYSVFAQEANRLLAAEEAFRNFRVLGEVLRYSLFVENPHKLEDKIRLFYFGG